MRSGLLVRSRLLIGCAFAAMATVTAGCTTAPPAPTVSGQSLVIYLSAPSSLTGDPEAQDVVDAEKLAFSPSCTGSSCAPIHVGNFTIHLSVVTDPKISNDARSAIEDKTAVAYLGEVLPGASADSLGITNAQDVL